MTDPSRHTHQDQLQIFYDYLPSSLQTSNTNSNKAPLSTLRDTTQVDFSKPLQIAYIGPSITPLTGLNAGYRVYQIDAKTFSVMGAQTYFANISNTLAWTRPVWEFEYDSRQAYAAKADVGSEVRHEEDANTDSRAKTPNPNGVPWPATSPLNATFWHLVTEKMLSDATASPAASSPLLHLYNTYESKSSSAQIRRGGDETTPEQKVCFIRAGSGALGTRCRLRYGADARGPRERAFGLV